MYGLLNLTYGMSSDDYTDIRKGTSISFESIAEGHRRIYQPRGEVLECSLYLWSQNYSFSEEGKMHVHRECINTLLSKDLDL